jgi:hypothetical protein
VGRWRATSPGLCARHRPRQLSPPAPGGPLRRQPQVLLPGPPPLMPARRRLAPRRLGAVRRPVVAVLAPAGSGCRRVVPVVHGTRWPGFCTGCRTGAPDPAQGRTGQPPRTGRTGRTRPLLRPHARPAARPPTAGTDRSRGHRRLPQPQETRPAPGARPRRRHRRTLTAVELRRRRGACQPDEDAEAPDVGRAGFDSSASASCSTPEKAAQDVSSISPKPSGNAFRNSRRAGLLSAAAISRPA